MSTPSPLIPSLYAVGQDPRLYKILKRAISVEDSIRYLQSRATALQSADKAESDEHFKELEAVIDKLLKDLVFDLWNTKSSTLDELSWLWLPPDHAADLRDFLGRLYCILKLVEGIREENLNMESTSINSSPATLGHQSLESNKHLEPFHADPETSPASLSQQLRQDDRHQRTILRVCDKLAELSEVFSYHHYRLGKYVAKLRSHCTPQRETLNSPLAVEDAAICSQPLSTSLLGASKCPESCSTHEECSSLLQISKTSLGNDLLERKRKASDQSFENGAEDLSRRQNDNHQRKRREVSNDNASDTSTEPWSFDPDREEFKELRKIRDEIFTQLVLMQRHSSLLKVIIPFTNYEIEIKHIIQE